MTPDLRLNAATAHTWAAVVSGTAWRRHTLESDGELTAEYARGPLILWANSITGRQKTGVFPLNSFVDGLYLGQGLNFDRDNRLMLHKMPRLSKHLGYVLCFSASLETFAKYFIDSNQYRNYIFAARSIVEHFIFVMKKRCANEGECRKKHPKLYARLIHWQ